MEKKVSLLTEIQEVPRESLLLMAGPPGAGKTTFCCEMVLNGVAAERPVIFVTTERSPSGITDLLREKGVAAPVSLSFVDAFAKTVGLEALECPDAIEASCEDLNSISMAITKLQRKIGRRDILLAFDSLTSPYLFNKEEVFRFMRLCLLKFASEGNSVVALMDEGCGKEEDLGAMMSVADAIIRMEIKENLRILNVVKHPRLKPTRIETPMTWNPTIALEKFDPRLMRRIWEASFTRKAGAALRTETGDFVDMFWMNLALWSGMLWDPKRVPAMRYEFEKKLHLMSTETMAQAPWFTRFTMKFFLPGSFGEVKDMKKFSSYMGKFTEKMGFGIWEYVKEKSRKDEHYFRLHESVTCWPFHNIGARISFAGLGAIAGMLKGLEKEQRDWNGVETKCIGLGDPYCELKFVPWDTSERQDFLESTDSSIVEKVHDRLLEQLRGFTVDNKPLPERPSLGSQIAFSQVSLVTSLPALFSERYRMALRMGGARTGKEIGEHLVNAGLKEDDVIKRVINLMDHCKVGKITLDDTIKIRENCESFGLDTGELNCFLTTGFLNGLFSAVKNQHVREVKCIAAGDPYCEWEII